MPRQCRSPLTECYLLIVQTAFCTTQRPGTEDKPPNYVRLRWPGGRSTRTMPTQSSPKTPRSCVPQRALEAQGVVLAASCRPPENPEKRRAGPIFAATVCLQATDASGPPHPLRQHACRSTSSDCHNTVVTAATDARFLTPFDCNTAIIWSLLREHGSRLPTRRLWCLASMCRIRPVWGCSSPKRLGE